MCEPPELLNLFFLYHYPYGDLPRGESLHGPLLSDLDLTASEAATLRQAIAEVEQEEKSDDA